VHTNFSHREEAAIQTFKLLLLFSQLILHNIISFYPVAYH